MSTHSVNIVEIEQVLPHENAERLEIVPVSGYQAVVKKGEFKVGDRAVYIEPDYTVPLDRPEFAFLAKGVIGKVRHRLKAVRLRGALSYGLLIPVPEEFKDRAVGDDVMADMNIERYEAPVQGASGPSGANEIDKSHWPKVYAPKFDIENYAKYSRLIQPEEEVVITEKIHGANARYVFSDGEFHIGSRQRWLKDDGENIWSRVAAETPGIRQMCEELDGTVLYGEIYGPVQSLRYGLSKPKFSLFAGTRNGEWIDQDILFSMAKNLYNIEHAPVLFFGPFDEGLMKNLAEQDSVLCPGQLMEGVVIVPAKERIDMRHGRVALKHISNRYWEFND